MPRPGSLPLHMQVSEGLIRDIAAGKLADGYRLPPERDMAEGLGIAIGTLRRALQTLQDQGLLHRVQGSGNYVRARADVASIYALFRLELLTGGGLPTAQVLSVDRLAKDPGLPAFGPHAEGHRIRRLRFLSGQPAAVEEIWLDATRADTVTADDRLPFPRHRARSCRASPAWLWPRMALRLRHPGHGITLRSAPMWRDLDEGALA